jgi:hypothetical protein
MKRRGFIKILTAGGATALYPAVLSSCSTGSVQEVKAIERNHGDIRLAMLSQAMLAPNSHNIQPWKIELTGNDSFDLYVDQDRLLPWTDPPARQIHISQGTFLETLKIAASSNGYRTQIRYFPQGEYDNQSIEDKPVASVRLISDPAIKQDPFYELLTVRQSNKRTYDNHDIPESDLQALREPYPVDGLDTFCSNSKELRRHLSPMLGKSMAIETKNLDRNKETVDLFRFNEAEVLDTRDGFSVANNGMTGLMRFIVETFFLGSRAESYAVDSAFSKEGIKMAYQQANSAAAYGWIVSRGNTRLDQIMAGHLYARINLLTAKLGIAQHPMSQILEEYADMRDIQKEFLSLLKVPEGSTVQMLYRLGYANPHPHTLRRRVGGITHL